MVTDRLWCDYICHFNGMKQRVVRVTPDLEYQAKILEATRTLEQCILSNIELYHTNTADFCTAEFIEEIDE
jgi:hypothetical protein